MNRALYQTFLAVTAGVLIAHSAAAQTSPSLSQQLATPPLATPTTTTTTTTTQAPVAAPRVVVPTAQAKTTTAANAQVPLSSIPPVDNQAIMNGLADAAGSGVDDAEEKSRKATYNTAINGLFPMSTEEIEQLIEKLHDNEKAIVGPSVGNPKAEVKVETISLEPGAQPREIQTDVGFVTTLSILDATGSPWPIQDVGVGGNFDVPAPEEGGNVLRLTPLAKYAVGNISIRLVGLNTPLTFKLRATTGTIYYLYDARIPKFGPKASAPLIDHGNDLVAGDAMLMSILDGTPPLDSTRLPVTGADQRTAAWRVGAKVYLRTPLTLLSPGWDGSVGSGDGTHVYLIPDTPVLLLSDNGNLIHARIGNNAKPDEQPVPAIEDGKAHPLRVSAAVADQTADQLFTRPTTSSQAGNDQILPSPNASRTLIRPVPVRSTAANTQTNANGAAPLAGFPAPSSTSTSSPQTQNGQ